MYLKQIEYFPRTKSDLEKVLERNKSVYVGKSIEDLTSSQKSDLKFVDKSTWNKIVKRSERYNFQGFVEYIVDKYPSEKFDRNKSNYYGPPYWKWINGFDNLKKECKMIRGIANSIPNIILIAKNLFSDKKDDASKIQFSLPVPINLQLPYINLEGELKIPQNLLLQTLLEIELHRLRVCPICDYVFWASKSHQKWCSAKCKSTNSKRKILSNPKKRNEINEQRRRNYTYKQGIKKENTTGNNK